jgi:N utilization substance protein B
VKARRVARRIALDVLYEADIKDLLPLEVFGEHQHLGWNVADDEEWDEPTSEALAYAHRVVAGVQEHHADLDLLISRYADRWAIERMPVIDRTITRIALFELLWGEDVPVAVAINEAVELAKSFSTDDSGRFVNGLLGRIAEKEIAPPPSV